MRHNRFVALALVVLVFPLVCVSIVGLTPNARALVLYDSGDPTPAEQLVLEYINRARSNPVAEGQRLGIDIHEGLSNPNLVGPRPPLAMNKILLSIARAQSQDMYNLNYFSHTDPNGTTPFDRITHAGYDYSRAGENMAAGADLSAIVLEDLMMIDGDQGRPHRVNLLDLINPYPCGNPPCTYYEVGIGFVGAGALNGMDLNSLITEDFGTSTNGPFLLGVAYNDKNGNNFYDIGEGIGGVTITASAGNYYAISSSAGGYAFPIGTSGTMTVTASGPGFGPITKTVTLNGTNVELNFSSQAQTSVLSTTSSSSQSTTSTSSQSIASTLFQPITFQTIPSNFPGATTPGTITACGNTYANAQSTSSCGNSFTATASLPTPSTGWQFDHWIWTGGVSCSGISLNPVSCSVSASGGTLTAAYGAQVTFRTNPASSTLIGWTSCANLGQGASLFSTTYGPTPVTACYIPLGYTISNWSCSSGLACSGSNNPTTVAFVGPGTLTLNLQAQTETNSATVASSTAPTMTPSSSTTTATSKSTLTFTNSTTMTYSAPEFGFSQAIMITSILLVFAILVRRKSSKRR